MWKVLGEETVIVNAGEVWAEQLVKLSQRRKDAPKFKDLLAQADVRYYFDAIKEVHVFYLQFPAEVTPEDLEFLKGFILKLHKAAKAPVVEFDGEAQQSAIVLSSDKPADDHKKRNPWWEKEEEKEERQAI